MKEEQIYNVIQKNLKKHIVILITIQFIVFTSIIALHVTSSKLTSPVSLLIFVPIIGYFLYKKQQELKVLQKGKLLSFEIIGSTKHLLSRGVFYIPMVRCLENGEEFELKEKRNVAPFLKGSLIRGYYLRGKVLLIDRFIY